MSTSVDILKRSDLRKTPFRIRVLDYFILQPHAAVRNTDLEQNIGDFDRITLYRTLKTFEEKGIIHEVVDGSKDQKYALCHHDCKVHISDGDHAHFSCKLCGNTYCLDSVGELNIQLPSNYVLDKVQVMLSGTCDNCK